MITAPTFSEDTLEVARYLTEAAKNGYNDRIKFESIETALPNLTCPILQQACFDLELDNFVIIDAVLGQLVDDVRLNSYFFEIFDPVFGETNPKLDALELARKLLDLNSSILANDLEVLSNWPRRRFNPAFSIITDILPQACLSIPMRRDYPATRVNLDPEGRAILTRFIDENV